MRVVSGRKGYNTHIKRLEDHIPDTGQVKVFRFTESQYENRLEMTNTPDPQEEMIGNYHHICL